MKLKSKLKSKLKKLLVVLPVFIVVFSIGFSCFAAVPPGFMRMPINVGNNWLEDYGQISPSITNGDSSFEFKLPTAYYPPFETGRYFSVDFFSVQPSIINNYNDYYFGLKCFNTEVMSATLSFKGTDLSYEFTSDGYVDGYDYLHLELESFNFPSSEINIYIVFRKVYEGNYNIILDEFYYRGSSTGNIINNQNENADKIIGSLGGSDDYNAPTDGDLGDLEDTEDALVNENKAQSDEANTRIKDNVLGSIQRFYSAFGATMAMFQDMTVKLPDLSVLIYFSLIMGIVPIIVGLTINNLRGHDAKVARERRRSEYRKGG